MMNIQWSKKSCYTWSSLVYTCIFWVFFFCYWPKSFMEGDEGDVFSKAPDWKPLFSLKIKMKQNPGCSNKEYNVIVKYFHQNTRVYLRSKIKSALTKQRKALTNRFGFSLIHLGGLGGVATPGRFCHISPHLETVFLAFKLTQNCYINMKISFSWKT